MTVSSGATYDFCAFSDALTDVIVRLGDDESVEDQGLTLGRSETLGSDQGRQLRGLLEAGSELPVSAGGSPANTICGLARLGARAAFVGRIGRDRLGDAYENALTTAGVRSHLRRVEGESAICYTLVSPDGERSFGIDLGVAAGVQPDDLDADAIRGAAHFHTSAYQLRGGPRAAETTRHAVELVRSAGRRLSLDLGDALVVERHREALEALLAPRVDVLFANIHEARALARMDASVPVREVVDSLSELAETVVVTRSAEGCLVRRGDEVVAVPGLPVQATLDCNGAGDAFSAGFLYALWRGLPLTRAARTGNYYASLVIREVGAQLSRRFSGLEDDADRAYLDESAKARREARAAAEEPCRGGGTGT